MAMKSNQRLKVILGSLADVNRACIGEKEVSDTIDFIGMLTGQLVESLKERKREVKNHGREQGDRMRGDLQALENQLFNTKVESETLKIDKRYYEEQVHELKKKNTELNGNLDNMKSEKNLN